MLTVKKIVKNEFYHFLPRIYEPNDFVYDLEYFSEYACRGVYVRIQVEVQMGSKWIFKQQTLLKFK